MKIRAAILTFLTAAVFPASAGNWPCFRGPTRQGEAGDAALPLQWDATKGVKWRTPIPGEGHSSPIVWGDRIFVTTATDDGRGCEVLCLDAADGKVRWRTRVFDQVPTRKESRNSHATPTPVTDGERVYAVFGGGGIAALDFEGRVVWTFREFRFYSRHGLGASPLLEDGLLVMPWDWSTDPDKEGADRERVGWQLPWDRSFVFALEAKTGKLAWKTGRGQSRIAHITPTVWTDASGRKQVISPAGDVVQGFDLRTGERLWSAENPGEGVSPSPVIAAGLVIQPNGFGGADSVRAFRLEGAQGDVGERTMAWEQAKNAPKLASMVQTGGRLYAVAEGGMAWCADACSGEVLWRERLDGSTFASSPILAGDRIYITGDEGLTFVLKAGERLEVLAKNPLGERVQASPAVWNGHLVIRGERHVHCIGE